MRRAAMMNFQTSRSVMRLFGATQLASALSDCAFKTLDISGDGENNEGFKPKDAFNHFRLKGSP